MSAQTADVDDRQKYLRNFELRAEIAGALGMSPARFLEDGTTGAKVLLKKHVLAVAREIQPEDSDVDVDELDLVELYRDVCEWAGGEYVPNAGNPCGINRENLKKIHRAVTEGSA